MSFPNSIFDFDLVSGRYVIDAKSIMGIFSLDLAKPIDLNIHAEGEALEEVLESFKTFISSNRKDQQRLRVSQSLFLLPFFRIP